MLSNVIEFLPYLEKRLGKDAKNDTKGKENFLELEQEVIDLITDLKKMVHSYEMSVGGK